MAGKIQDQFHAMWLLQLLLTSMHNSMYYYISYITPCKRYQVPVRMVFERNEDIPNTGGRHPFKGMYKVTIVIMTCIIMFYFL